MKSIYVGSVRELARWLPVIVEADYQERRKISRGIDRMAHHCLCPVDIRASAEASGYRVVDEPMTMRPDIIIEKIVRASLKSKGK